MGIFNKRKTIPKPVAKYNNFTWRSYNFINEIRFLGVNLNFEI